MPHIDDPSSADTAPRRRTRGAVVPDRRITRRWLRCFITALTSTVLATALASCSTAGSGTGPEAHSSHRSTVPGTSPTPACHLRVLEQGFSIESHQIQYAVMVENPCKKVALRSHIAVFALNKSGKTLDGNVPQFPVIMPGQKVGAAGTLTNSATVGMPTYNPHDVDRLKVEIDHSDWLSVTKLKETVPDLARATGTDIHIGSRDAQGTARITFKVQTDPPHAPLYDPVAYIVLRNRTGKIIAGARTRVYSHAGETAEDGIWVPSKTDVSLTKVYISQDVTS